MVDFIQWIFSSFSDMLFMLTSGTLSFINDIVDNTYGETLFDFDINIVLFSDTPILQTNLFAVLTIFFSIFYTIIFIVIVWKIIKKVFVKITGWEKW